MAGKHNVQNSLAAIAVARELGGTQEQIRAALEKFGGVKRRFTPVGEWVPKKGGNKKVQVIDDYGHHPVEIAAVLKAARDVQGTAKRVIAIVQPHRYTRLRDLFEQFSTCFNDADHVIVAPVYAAGEKPIDGYSHETLVKSLIEHGHRSAQTIEGLGGLAPAVKKAIQTGDEMVVCLGAGDITTFAGSLADDLGRL
jgi:UDP-N-acetylmuramate--alanine ligase